MPDPNKKHEIIHETVHGTKRDEIRDELPAQTHLPTHAVVGVNAMSDLSRANNGSGESIPSLSGSSEPFESSGYSKSSLEEPSTHTRERISESIRNGSEHSSAPTSDTRSPSLFWNGSLSEHDELNWFVPPLPYRKEADVETEELLNEFGRTMDNQPRRAWLLRWNYRTRAAAAAAEQTLVEEEAQAIQARLNQQGERELIRIDTDMVRLNEQRQSLEKELLDAQNAFSEAAARAGLHCEALPPEPSHQPPPSRLAFWRRNLHADEQGEGGDFDQDLGAEHTGRITPQVVEDALLHSGPTQEELAGEYGVAPVGREDLLSRILSFFMQFLAPLVAGMMLALCLGTLVGILDIDTLQRPDSVAQVVLSALLGFVIVYLMGELFHSTVATLARSLEAHDPENPRPIWIPHYHGNRSVAIVLLVLAVGLGLAEVTAEGMGIRQLHQQQIAKQNRFRNTPAPVLNQTGSRIGNTRAGTPLASPPSLSNSEELPLLLYLLIGTLISGPYLAYKTARGWNEHEAQLRESWLMHRQRLWLDNRRADSDVQSAFHHAYNVEQTESNLMRIRSQILMLEDERMAVMNMELPGHLQIRRREARAAAVGEAARLQQALEDLVDAHEPMQMPVKAEVHLASDPNYRPNRRGRNGSRR